MIGFPGAKPGTLGNYIVLGIYEIKYIENSQRIK
jgi:hypothetical protein